MMEVKKAGYIQNNILRILLIIFGFISVFLGILGMFLPLLPTTPFLLLAAYFFARSSKKFYYWLITNRMFGEYIRNYKEGSGIRLKHKILTLLLLWITISFSLIFIADKLWLQILLIIVAISVSIHLLIMKTYSKEDKVFIMKLEQEK